MTVCENCKQNLKEMRLSFYKDGIEAMKEGWIGLLPEDVFDSIVERVFPHVVTIHYTCKTRCDCNYCLSGDEDSSYSDDENDSDIDIPCDGLGYLYKDYAALLCSRCFLEGIQRVYGTRGELPYMRYHADAFFNKLPVTVSPYKYQLPSTYNVTYYRRKQPVRHQGKLYITNQ